MPVSSYGGSTDSLAAPSLSSWAASVSSALDGSDTTVNTRITQRVLPLTAKTGNYTLTASDTVVTCNGTLTITLPTAVGLTGKQFIINNIATNTVTIARTSSQTIDGCSGTITLAGKGSMTVVSDGANWLVISAQYTDESIGRRIFTWSSALSSGATTGWQMTYGDTGFRELSAALSNGWTVTSLLIRRVNSTVHMHIYNLKATSATNATFYTLPSGFKLTLGSNGMYIPASKTLASTTSDGLIGVTSTSGAMFSQGSYAGFTASQMLASWSTSDSWPSSLPGSASGSVPAS